MNYDREKRVGEQDCFGPDPRTRISLSLPVFKELVGKNGLAFGQLERPLVAGLEQQQWRHLYRMVQHPADCVELLRLFNSDPELRAQVPALYMTATVNAGRFARKQRRWEALADIVKAPLRWLTDRRTPSESGSDRDDDQALLLKLMSDPEFADLLVTNGLGAKGRQPKRVRPAAAARKGAGTPAEAAGAPAEGAPPPSAPADAAAASNQDAESHPATAGVGQGEADAAEARQWRSSSPKLRRGQR